MSGTEKKRRSTEQLMNIDELKRLVHEGKRITQEHNKQFAMSLLGAGFSILPCDWLRDNQIVVSRQVYDAIAKEGRIHNESDQTS